MDPYEDLANAIVLKAVSDYRNAIKQMRNHPEETIHWRRKKEVEQFIRSSWFGVLTSLNPAVLLEHIKEEVCHD